MFRATTTTCRTSLNNLFNSRRHYSGNAGQYCRDFVRKHDYESWVQSAFYPAELQDGYFALKAFYIDLAMIQDSVSSPMIGKLRMQFWRDAIKQGSQDANHPIATALHNVRQQTSLPAYHFTRIIDARDAELSTPAHLTIDSLTAHAESTSSTLLYLLLSLCSLPSSTLSHAASHLGVAQTLTTLIRALPFHAHNRRMVIPAEITAKHGVIQEDVFRRGAAAPGIDSAVFEFATLANDHLITARSMFKDAPGGKVPPKATPIFLAGVPARRILERLEKAHFDAFEPSLQRRPWNLAGSLWLSYYRQKF